MGTRGRRSAPGPRERPASWRVHLVGEAVRNHLRGTHGDTKVIVVDDGSTDDTVAVARKAVNGDSRLRVVSAGPLPTGRVGTSWACHRGAEEATGQHRAQQT